MLNALEALLNLKDEGVTNLDQISITNLQTIYEEVVIFNPDELTFPLKTIARTKLKSMYRLLFDVVHRVFLS